MVYFYHLTQRILRFSIFIFILLITTVASAQDSNKQDVIYLKNGSIIKGEIEELKPDEYVKIRILGGSILYFKLHEVERIAKEKIEEKYLPNYKGDYNFISSGYFGAIEWTLIFGGANDPYRTSGAISMQTVHGYYFNRFIGVGAGVGVDHYPGNGYTFSPFFLRVTGEAFRKPVTPFYFVDGGYSVAWNYSSIELKGGLMLNPGIGIKLNSRSAVSYTFSVSYKMQKFQEERFMWTPFPQEPLSQKFLLTYNRVALRFGIAF